MKILFMGTPDFAVPTLDIIIKSNHELIGVVTQPDRPKGRGERVFPSPIKEKALAHNLKIYQPEKVKSIDFIQNIKQLQPDLIITAAFGQILPKAILDIPSLGCINVHASLLPKYRGASPIQQVLIDGEKETGITIMYMDIGMDTGDIILQKSIQIYPDEQADKLHDRLRDLGADLIKDALKLFENGRPLGKSQNHEEATYCSKIEKSMGRINWSSDSLSIKNLVRGLTPWPGTFTYFQEQRLKVWKVKEWQYSNGKDYNPGQIINADSKNGLIVACGKGFLRLEIIQLPGKRQMTDIEFLKGNSIPVGGIMDNNHEVSD